MASDVNKAKDKTKCAERRSCELGHEILMAAVRPAAAAVSGPRRFMVGRGAASLDVLPRFHQ